MKYRHIIISHLVHDENQLRVDIDHKSFHVTVKGTQIDNIERWMQEPRSITESQKDFVERTSIDADTYFAVFELVTSYIKINRG